MPMAETDFCVSENIRAFCTQFYWQRFCLFLSRFGLQSQSHIQLCFCHLGQERLKRPQIRSLVTEQQSTRDSLVVMLGFLYLLGNFCVLFPFNISHLLLNAISG
jgi:hypothetical protein